MNMPDATYDAVIIGAGHNGMTLAAYLAKAGWDVAVFESRHEEGGGLATEEVTRPGFLHNTHANYHTLVGVCPVYDELNLYDHGVRYVRPPVQMGALYSDGTALTIHTDVDKTCASIARFSQKDADTFRRLFNEAKGFMDLLIRTLMYSPPIPLLDITKALVTWKVEEISEFLSVHLRNMTVNDFLNQHFENERVKAMLAFHISVGGYCTDRKGLAISVPLLVGKVDNWHVCVGGSHNLAHALWEAVAHSGGHVFLNCGVEEIIIENGRATGVRLADGSVVAARHLVASSIDLEQTFLKLIKDGLSQEFIQKVESYPHMDWSFFTVHLALSEAPQYRAAEFDPDINQAWVLNVGYESLEDLNDDWQCIRRGEIPSPKPNCTVNTLFDPLDAPEGCYTGLIRQFAPYDLAKGGPEAWDDRKQEYGQRCIDKWASYAPNLRGAIMDWAPHTPLDITRRIVNMVKGDWMGGLIDPSNLLDERPFPELSQYRTPFKGLYMCGATQHPHGFITFAPARNALEIIAEDYHLERWWR
jgi:phytoene dehydrogenase-like protein